MNRIARLFHRHTWETTHVNPYMLPIEQACRCGAYRHRTHDDIVDIGMVDEPAWHDGHHPAKEVLARESKRVANWQEIIDECHSGFEAQDEARMTEKPLATPPPTPTHRPEPENTPQATQESQECQECHTMPEIFALIADMAEALLDFDEEVGGCPICDDRLLDRSGKLYVKANAMLNAYYAHKRAATCKSTPNSSPECPNTPPHPESRYQDARNTPEQP